MLGDRGAAATQLVLVFPALILVLLMGIQFALAWHAQHIAQTAASQALAAASTQHGNAGGGQARAREVVSRIGGRVLVAPSVRVTRGAETVHVRVSGGVIAVAPGLDLRAEGTAAGPVDRWTTPGGR
ncbi:TadE family protein [Streptomyces monticola]|uniref:TadE family protein n=1 Tax=Streptomyces monticola TaxID=2666263 RepID=A0ABW2JL00_9ACTN